MPLSDKLSSNHNLQNSGDANLPYLEPQPHIVNKTIKWVNPKLNSSFATSIDVIYSICQKIQSKQFSLTSINNIAQLLEIPIGQLIYILNNKSNFYEQFTIPKKNGGERIINSPLKGLAIIQKKLKIILDYFYRPKKSAHGFIKDKSILTNASEHTRKRYVLNIDLENYFGTITFARVYGIFKAQPFNFPHQIASVLASICTYENVLPQGACTSPVLANLISASLDKNLTLFAKNHKATYTRYADDITFSFNQEKNKAAFFTHNEYQVLSLNKQLISIIKNNGFEINFRKLRVQTPDMRQEVTGLIVNKKVNITKQYLKTTRAMIHQWQYDREIAAEKFIIKKGIDIPISKEKAISIFRNHIYGRLSFIKMIRGNDFPMYLKLMSKMTHNDTKKTEEGYRTMKLTQQYEVFICHAGEDKKEIAIPIYNELTKLKIRAFIDHEEIGLGESIVQKINNALIQAKYVIAILSKNSVDKAWPLRELHSVISTELKRESTHLIPVIRNGDEAIVAEKLPLINDKRYHVFKDDPDVLAAEIQRLLARLS